MSCTSSPCVLDGVCVDTLDCPLDCCCNRASTPCSQSSSKLSWCTSHMVCNMQQAAMTFGILSIYISICFDSLCHRPLGTPKQSLLQLWLVLICSCITFDQRSVKQRIRMALSAKVTWDTQNLQP